MKKQILALSLAGIISCAYVQAADPKLEWEDAKKLITEKAQTIVDNYAKACPTITPIYETILSEDFSEAWNIVENSLSDIKRLDIYKKAIKTPQDDILWAELGIQAGAQIGQIAGQKAKGDMTKGFQLGMKAGAICSSYLELLRNELKK